MGQILGNVLKLAAAGLGDVLKLDTAPDGMQVLGIRLNGTVPCTVTGTPTLAQADFVTFLKHAIGSLTLEEGPKTARRTPLIAVDGNDLRTVHRWWYQNECPNTVYGAALGTGAQNLTFTIFVPFCPPPYYRGTPRLAGTTQVRQMVLRVFEGTGAMPANVARAAGNITLEVEFVTVPGPDTWAPILSVQRDSSPRRDLLGPDGVTLLSYVPDTAAASSALTAFNVQILDGTSALRMTDLQVLANLTNAFKDELVDQGASPSAITDEHTVLHFVPYGVDLDRWPHGAMRFEEAKSDLSPINARTIFLPPRDPVRATAEAQTSADVYGTTIKVSQPIIDEDADPGAAATQAARIFKSDDSRFTGKPGLVASPGAAVVTVDVPGQVQARVKATAAAAKGGGATVARDAAKRAVKVVSLAIPGSTATDGTRKGAVNDGLVKVFADVA